MSAEVCEPVPRIRVPARCCGTCPVGEPVVAAVREQRLVRCPADAGLVCKTFVELHWIELPVLRQAERHGLVEMVDADDP